MKRILFVHHVSDIGGGSYCLLNLTKNIDRSQFEPIVLLKFEGPLCNELRSIGVGVVLFKDLTPVPYNQSIYKCSSIRSYQKVKKSLKAFKNLLSSIKPDVLYINNMMLYPYLKPAKEIGIKTVIHIREHWPLDEHKHQLKKAQECVVKYGDGVVAINRYSANMFQASHPVVIYDWIDMTSRYEKHPLQEYIHDYREDMRIFLYMGSIQSIKGPVEVIQSFIEKRKSERDRLLLVGLPLHEPRTSGIIGKAKLLLHNLRLRESYTHRIYELIESDKRITLIPATYNLTHIIKQCYCNLSYFTIPHANLAQAECIICGVPSIVGKTDESLEYSLEGTLSALYNFDSIDDFKHSLYTIDSDYLQLKSNIDTNKTIIEKMFDKGENIRRWNSFLSETLN